jgi:hypothetical protein
LTVADIRAESIGEDGSAKDSEDSTRTGAASHNVFFIRFSGSRK